MLILSRRCGENLWIVTPDGTEICISVGQIQGAQAKVSVNAPPEYRVVRGELYKPSDQPDAVSDLSTATRR